MERKNSLISDFLIPVGYTVLVYAIWEGIGFFVSFVIGKMTENWTNSLNNTYVVMLLQEISVFLIMYVLFHKKVDFVRDGKSSVSLLSAFAMLIFPLIQIGDDLMAIFYGKRVFSLFSGKGIQFFVICCIASLSIGLMEEFVWRGIILNGFLSAWKDKKKDIDIFPLLWALSLYESAGRTGIFEYHKTGNIRSVYGSVFISALFADKPLDIFDSGTRIM